MLVSLAWRNIWRQPMRSVLSILGMALTSMLLVFMLSFQLGSYDMMKTGSLRLFDGFGQFQPVGYPEDPDISRRIENADAIITALGQLPAVTSVTARATGFVILANGDLSFGAAVMGVDPNSEADISTLASTIKEGRYLQEDDTGAIVLGDGLARNLKLEVGDGVVLLGSGTDGSVAADVLTLVGVFSSGVPELDRQIAQMPLARFQEVFALAGDVNTIALAGDNLADIVGLDAELRQIAADNGVLYRNWEQLQPAIKQMIQLDMGTSGMMYITLVIVVVFIILNTLYMSVLERTREFGGLLALGMRPRSIGKMVWLELIFLSFLGAGLGIVFGVALTLYFINVGIYIPGMDDIYAQWGIPSRLFPSLTPFSVLIGPGVIVASICILGFIPYRRILGLEPVTAMASP
ncbi:MAG: ABC transporter permease [Rhodobacteraceae bacterium]|nr:ABC transporter permease [Paracoccaceae bacterium]